MRMNAKLRELRARLSLWWGEEAGEMSGITEGQFGFKQSEKLGVKNMYRDRRPAGHKDV